MIKRNTVSVIIIARNEGTRIMQCLEGVSWADEILLIDNGSTDDTGDLARKAGATVVLENSNDFSGIRNSGAAHAQGEWLLYVDADELVTPQLRDEIKKITKGNSQYDAFFISRQNYYLGTKWPVRDGMVRLIRKKSLVRWEGILHEHAVVLGETGKLINHLLHHTHRTLDEMVTKTNEWSVFEAKLRFDHHHPAISWWRLLRVMITAFFTSYISQGGWKAGTVGWIESIYQAFSIYITYAKLWELQQKS